MKVISLTEPYATLIRNGIKTIETRSWKTNYRGKLYIHASATRIPAKTRTNTALMALVGDAELNHGKIICACELADCVEMTEAYITEIQKNGNEYISGIYEVGRYAWILKDIVALDDPIPAKGRLGIWNHE